MINGPGGDQYAERQTQQGGDWFFWIAGLSIANSVLRLIHSPVGVFFGLGTTDVIDYYGASPGGPGSLIALGSDGLVAGLFALFRLFQGFQAAGQLAALRAQSAGGPYGGYVPPASTPSNDVWPPPPSA